MTSELLSSVSESLQATSPEIVVLPSENDVDRYAYNVVSEVIADKADAILTLATGSSPLGLYRLLIKSYQENHLDFSRVTTKNLDEYWPIAKSHPQSYDRFMRDNLFDYVNIPECNRHIPNCEAENPHEEVLRYQETIRKIGPSDLTILGIGPELTCHIAFNERGSEIDSRTRLVQIDEETVKANARFFDGDESRVPKLAMTQGIADILESRRIILIAKGFGKAEGIKRALEGEIGPDAPASFLRMHPNVTFILDQKSGSRLNGFDNTYRNI